MGAPLLKINGFDFSPYLNVQHEDGMDPLDPDRVEPQFAGSPAFREGKAGVGEAVDNREWTMPLILEAADRAALNKLVERANRSLEKGAIVEFAIDEAVDPISYFALEAGRVDGLFQYYLSVHATTRATLKLWTSSFATTGTTRLIASVVASGALVVNATGIAGDTLADVRLGFRLPSTVPTIYFTDERPLPVIAYGLRYPAASGFNPFYSGSSIPAASGPAEGNVTASVTGASGRVASQYKKWAVSNFQTVGNTPQHLARLPLRNQDAGRYRALLVMRHFIRGPSAGLSNPPPASTMLVLHRRQTATTLIPLASIVASNWQLVDAGEVTIGDEYDYLTVSYKAGASGATAWATYPVQIDTIALLPIDQRAGIFVGDIEQMQTRDRYRYEFDSASTALRLWTSTAYSPSYAQSGGTQLLGNEVDRLRGDMPMLPPVPSGSPSGPAKLVALFGFNNGGNSFTPPEWVGNLGYTLDLSVRERFTYLR